MAPGGVTAETVRTRRRQAMNGNANDLDAEKERRLMGLEFILGGLRDGLAVMDAQSDEWRSFSPLVASIEERIQVLRSSGEPPRRDPRRFGRATR
jgi:hypothetical protein